MEIEYEARPDYMRVSVRGAFDGERARKTLGEILLECQARQIAKIFVDARALTTAVSVADRYDLAIRFADYGAGRARMAILVSPENMLTKTLENTAANRGASVRTTASLDEAFEFLDLPR